MLPKRGRQYYCCSVSPKHMNKLLVKYFLLSTPKMMHIYQYFLETLNKVDLKLDLKEV